MSDQLDQSRSSDGADLWEALGRYLSGESTSLEADRMARWLAEREGREEVVAGLRRSLEGLRFTLPGGLDVEAALQQVSARLDEPEVAPITSARSRRAPRVRTMGLRAAAAVALVAGAAILWRMTQAVNTPAVSAVSYATTIGQTDSVRLADGSLAVLAPASRLEVAGRTAELTGEALFEVIHDAAHPFRVRAGSAVVEDLGTTFIVRDEPEGVQVVVTEGSVLLQGRDQQQGGANSTPAGGVVLRAGDRGTMGQDGRPVIERSVATADDLAWTRGRLLFDNAPLSRVRTDLRRWYGVELRVDSSLASRHLTASFSGEPAGQVLDVIALALGARLERRGDTAFVRAR